MDQSDQGMADDIGRASKDISEANVKSSISIRKIARSFDMLGGVISSTGSAFADTSTEFKKFNKVVDSSEKLITSIGGNYGAWGAVLNAVTIGLSALAKSVFAYNDNILKSYDNLSQFGGTLGINTKDLNNLIKESGYYAANSAAFDNAVNETGTAFINLGWNTSDGVTQLAKILNVQDINGLLGGFLNLGLSPKAVTKAQVDYIKMQESLGISLKNNFDKTRTSSLDYLTGLSSASAMTGESRDSLAKSMAKQLLDYKFASKIRQLEMEGRGEDAQRLVLFAAMIDKQYGPEHGIAVRDYIANGFPTTAEGESLLLTQKGEFGEMVRKLENGQATIAETYKEYAVNIVDIDKQYGSSIRASEQAQKDYLITGQAYNTASKVADQELTAINKDLDNVYSRSSDKLNNLRTQQLITQRKDGQAMDYLNQNLAPTVNDATSKLSAVVVNVAKKMAYLARWLSGGESSEAFNNVMTALGDAKDLQELSTRLTQEAKDVDKKIKKQESSGTITANAKQKYEQALEEQQKLIERKKAGQPVTGREERNITDTVNETRLLLEAARAAERNRYGKTTEELKAERESLLKRSEEAKKSASDKSETEQRQAQNTAMANALDKSELIKYIQFTSGSGDLNHFQALAEKNPKLASSVVNLAKEYYKINGKQLEINSSYRNDEEQQAIYKAWTQNKKGSGYYNPHDPKNGPGPHTLYNAVDIDKTQLNSLGASVLAKFGLERRNPKDPVHVTLKRDETARFDASQIQALNPQAGQGVRDFIAHGTEAVVPMLDGNTVGIEMKPSTNPNDFSESKTNISKIKPDNSLIQKFAGIKPNKTVIDKFMDKLDGLGVAIDQSTSVQHDIKLYSMS